MYSRVYGLYSDFEQTEASHGGSLMCAVGSWEQFRARHGPCNVAHLALAGMGHDG